MNRSSAATSVLTHEGAPAQWVSPYLELKRSLMTCLLWEDSFYGSGSDQAQRIAARVAEVDPAKVSELAIEARSKMYLRHAPLFVCRELARRRGAGQIVFQALTQVIQRADEMAELLAMFWGEKGDKKAAKDKIPNAVKRALAVVFPRFDAYALGKYNRDNPIKLRDVFRIAHPKAESPEQYAVWKKLAAGELESPDTWEVALSAGKNKRETWERLLSENKLGGLAALRNLRNMINADVDESLIRARLTDGKFTKVLPFRFIAASRYAVKFEPEIEQAMLRAVDGIDGIDGTTGLLIDVSGSMDSKISVKSELTRIDAASALAILLREKVKRCEFGTFSDKVIRIPARRGFALRDAIEKSQDHSSTYLADALRALRGPWAKMDRVIVITDEQSHDGIVSAWTKRGYVINVAGNQHGVSYGNGWTHIDGWSERVLDYIRLAEAEDAHAK